ncbi:ABC transporter permease subunit [Actinacidiphila sp. bgisy167]|uniref:ABC transporter permease subunit n=1 Tax=Actinacidiphila sp. bgisy167 TaxID=3413797 RepID=UPI003D72F556
MAATTAVLQSEWTKVRTVRSTVWTLASAAVSTIVISGLFCLLFRTQWDTIEEGARAQFDPTAQSLSGLFLGQLALITFGVLIISSEYSTGMIRASLSAVPQRAAFYFSKVAVAAGITFVLGLIVSFVSFFVGQAILGGDLATSISDPGVLRAVFGAGLYMTLMVLFAVGVAAMLRSPLVSLGILIPFFFLVSGILSAVPGAKSVARYFPDQAGSTIMRATIPPNDPAPYGPWSGLGIMALWVVAALIGGYVLLKKRDA